MSYILDALKKVEQQRELGRVPGIGSDHEHASGKFSGRWLWLIVAVLLLNAGLLITILWPQSEPKIVVTKAAMEPVEIRRQEAPEPVTEAPLRRIDRSVPPASAPAQGAVLQTQPPASPRPVKTEPAVTPGINPQLVESPVSGKTPVAARPPQAVATPTRPSLPIWPQLPSHLLQQLKGSLRLDVHVYSDRPQERFVLINLQKYHEGEQLQEGPQLDEITQEGVILSFRGQQFRVQAQ